MAGYWTQLELTVITCQTPTTVLKQVNQVVTNLSMDIIKVHPQYAYTKAV